jgi:hypothetical protein
MASGTRHSEWRLGSKSSRRNRSFTPTSMGAIVRWPVTASASSAHGSRTVRPSTTRPQRGRHYLPCHWASRRALGRSGRSVWPYPVSSYGASRPIRVKPTYRRTCSSGPTSSWQTTKPWSASGGFPSDSSRPQGFNAMSSALPSTLRRGGLPCPRIKGRDANPSAVRWSAPPSHVQGAYHCRDATGPPGHLAAPSRANLPGAARGVLGRLGRLGCAAGRAHLQHRPHP